MKFTKTVPPAAKAGIDSAGLMYGQKPLPFKEWSFSTVYIERAFSPSGFIPACTLLSGNWGKWQLVCKLRIGWVSGFALALVRTLLYGERFQGACWSQRFFTSGSGSRLWLAFLGWEVAGSGVQGISEEVCGVSFRAALLDLCTG